MKVLFFCDGFAAPAYVPRIRYLCSFFAEKGWDLTLITEKIENQDFIPENFPVLTVDYYKNKKGIVSKIEWLLKFLLNLFVDHKGNYFYRKSRNFLKSKEFDLIFCSVSYTFPLTTATKIAKKLKIPLFADLRDIIEQSPDNNFLISHKPPKFLAGIISKIYKNVNLKRRNIGLESAICVSTVSIWHVKTLKKINPNTHLIQNGFDEKRFVPQIIPTNKFSISYFGRIYNDKLRDPHLFFAAIQNLVKKGLFSTQKITIQWFVDENSKNIIQKIAREYCLENFVQYADFINPENLSKEINKSSVALVLCNSTTAEKYFGIMTTKFFEAVGCNRPILCTPNNDDDLANVITEINCGLVSSNVSEIENFLLEKYNEWTINGFTKGSVSESIRMNFSRKNGAEILESLFLKYTKK